MDAHTVLLTQIDNLTKQLQQVEQAVQLQRLDADAHLRVQPMLTRVESRFDSLLSQQRTKITELRQKVLNNQPMQACWSQFRQLDQDCRSLFEECLAFIQGALTCANGVDEGMCLLADNLLDDLAAWADVGWRRFTILGTGELY